MYFFIETDDLLKKYSTISDKASTDIKREFDSKPIYNKRLLKTKIKCYGCEAIDFHDKEVPKAGSNHTCLAAITNDSILKKEENYYLQVFLKECQYIAKEVIRHITEDLEVSPDDSHESNEEQIKRL